MAANNDTTVDSKRPWKGLSLPDSVTRVKSLIAPEEQQYLTWLTSEKYQGWGAIVELGAWLGSSSVCLAEGLRRCGSGARIHTFDRFEWDTSVNSAAGMDMKAGTDFLPLYLDAITAYASSIDVKKLDLMGYVWEGGPIELLFIDSAKTWDLTSSLLRGFGAALVPERSRVVLQDFRYPWAHCLPLIFDSRPDVWEQVEDVDHGTTVTFTILKPLFDACGIHEHYSEEAFPFSAAARVLGQRLARERGDSRRYISQMLYRKCLIDGPFDEASKMRAQITADGADAQQLRMVEDIEHILHAKGWAAFGRGDFVTAKDCADRCLVRAGEKSIYSLTLLGFSLLSLGDHARTREVVNEILSQSRDFVSAKLLRAELASKEGQYEAVEFEVLEILRSKPSDEVTLEWCLNLLWHSWNVQPERRSHADVLLTFQDSLGHSAVFRNHLAREQALATPA